MVIRLLTNRRAAGYRWASFLVLTSFLNHLLMTIADEIDACFASLPMLCQQDHAS